MNEYDLKSEQSQEHQDRAEKTYNDYMRNLTVGDMRDLLESMMDDGQYLVTLLHIIVFTKDAQALLHHHDRKLKENMWKLSEQEADKHED